ncbi:MAG: HD domain-containing protein [Thermoguttaceae bacterium]|jgi:HD superfamily phosphohydrolase
MREPVGESISYDVIHGYIPFTSPAGLPPSEVCEQQIIDHPWVQRLRQIHQLQTAWWVYPTAEHTRFQHVLGAMHLASRAIAETYDSLQEVCPEAPSRGYVESLVRLAALLHDVGHGPFGHFFDSHYLSAYKLNHEIIGRQIIVRELAELVRRVRRNPNSRLRDDERLEPEQLGYLIERPGGAAADDGPRWLRFLRSLFCGLYTVDNMDFVLRDAYMSGYSMRAFDLDRLLRYSMFTERGLTIHERGLSALERFIAVRGELFRSVYYHRTVRAIDLSLQELFVDSKADLFPGNPLEHLDEYRRLTEWSLLVRVAEWHNSPDARLRGLGLRWQAFLARRLRWKMACERMVFFAPGQPEGASVFSDEEGLERRIRKHLPAALRELPFRVDIPRHVYRPEALAPTADQNFLYDSATGKIHRLTERELFRRIALSFRICRIYAESSGHNAELAAAMDQITGAAGPDDATNM